MPSSGQKETMNIKTYSRRYLPAIVVTAVFAIGSAAAAIKGPQKISDLMDEIMKGIMTGIDIKAFEKICFALVIIYSAGAIFDYGQQFIIATITQHAAKRLRHDIDTKINRLPLSYFDTTTKGDTLSRITNDVDAISQALSSVVANLISSAVLFVGVVIKMCQTNGKLTFVTIISSLIGFVIMTIIVLKSQKYFNLNQSNLGALNGHIEETYTNHSIVKAFGAKSQEKEKFNEINNRLYDSNWKSQCLSGVTFPVMIFVGCLSYVAVFVFGTSAMIKGNSSITLGTVMAFVIYSRLFMQPLQTFGQAMSSIQQASAASDRVFEMLEADELKDESGKTAKIKDVKGDVEFRNVQFGYSDEKIIINDFSAKLSAGQKVAIVGPTGAGKTTIVNLLMRFYDVNSGDILIDGISINDMKREEVHDLFDMILQDTWLFSGTIRENLVYNKKNVSDKTLDSACQAVGLKHFISTLPQGYDTVLSDSLNLSEGQKQQLTIARAMIKDSPMLILDEATSSVDTRTELVIQEAMDKLTVGRTSFVIAHRLSTIKNADIILVMKDGDIVEQGTHYELLFKGGFYAELYNSQFAED